jgi:hypothetical protein
MADSQSVDELANQVADAVRRAVDDAGARAKEILSEAEADAARIRERAENEAARIRERAEQDARQQIDAARKALDELGGSLAAAVSAATPGGAQPDTASPAAAESEPAPEPAPEPEPDEGESPGAPEAPVSPPPPEQSTVEETDTPQDNGDDAAERLVAMKLAVEGKDPSAIEAELIERFGPGDRSGLLRDVISRAAR